MLKIKQTIQFLPLLLLSSAVSISLLASCRFQMNDPTPADDITIRTEIKAVKLPLLDGPVLWEDIFKAVKAYGFYYVRKNADVDFTNAFEDMGAVVVDHATGLMWQKAGSERSLTPEQAREYIHKLNQEKHMGFNDWRLPSIFELCSLLEKEEQKGVHLSSIFSPKTRYCLSNSLSDSGYYWGVIFATGQVYSFQEDFFVKAVRQLH